MEEEKKKNPLHNVGSALTKQPQTHLPIDSSLPDLCKGYKTLL